MVDPVIASDGFTYERAAIEAWLARRATSPMTNLPMSDPWCFVPNRTLRARILDWQQQQDREDEV
jgi:E3 ubiquitin-protein ligase RGLG